AVDVGLYAVVYQLGYYPLSIMGGVLFQFSSPILFSIAGSGTNAERMSRAHSINRMVLNGTLFLTFSATVFAIFFHKLIFAILVGPEYRTVSRLLPFMVLSGGLYAYSYLQSLVLQSSDKTRNLLLPRIASSVAGVVLSVFLGYLFGVRGIVMSSLICSA